MSDGDIMRCIYNMVENPLTEDMLKELVRILEDKDEKNLDKSLYEILKESKNSKSSKIDYSQLKKIFMEYVNQLVAYDRTTIKKSGNMAMLNDYDLLLPVYKSFSNMSLDEIFKTEVFSKLRYKLIFPQESMSHNKQMSRYIHVTNTLMREKVECRIYMCPTADNCMELCNLLYEKHNKCKLPCYFKINSRTDDNDRIVLYSSFNSFRKHCKIIGEIRKENPNLFKDCEKNKLWANIKRHKDIYFGGEPYRIGSESYGLRLCSIIERSYMDFKFLYGEYTNEEDKFLSIIFTSTDQVIHYSIVCKIEDYFSQIEQKLYKCYSYR